MSDHHATAADRLAEAAKKFFDIWNEFGDMGASTLFECLGDYFPALEAALTSYDADKAAREVQLSLNPEPLFAEEHYARILRLRKRCEDGGHSMDFEAAHWQRIADKRLDEIQELRAQLTASETTEAEEPKL